MPREHTTLLVDIGNTRLKWCALADADGSADAVNAIAPADHHFEEALRTGLRARAWQQVWIANVGPPATLARLRRLCSELLPDVQLQHAHSVAQCGDLRNGYDAPAQLGVDRFLALLGACERWPGSRVMLVSIGSAVTVDLLERDGTHAGGLIAPSPAAMRKSLAGLATQLSVGEAPFTSVFARDTAAGITSGCTWALTGLIEHCVRTAISSGEPPVLVLSGGGAIELAQRLERESQVLPHLVLAGLAHYTRVHWTGANNAIDR